MKDREADPESVSEPHADLVSSLKELIEPQGPGSALVARLEAAGTIRQMLGEQAPDAEAAELAVAALDVAGLARFQDLLIRLAVRGHADGVARLVDGGFQVARNEKKPKARWAAIGQLVHLCAEGALANGQRDELSELILDAPGREPTTLPLVCGRAFAAHGISSAALDRLVAAAVEGNESARRRGAEILASAAERGLDLRSGRALDRLGRAGGRLRGIALLAAVQHDGEATELADLAAAASAEWVAPLRRIAERSSVEVQQRCVATLGRLLVVDEPKVRLAAANALAELQSADNAVSIAPTTRSLTALLGDHRLVVRAKSTVAAAATRALGVLAVVDSSIRGEIAQVLERFRGQKGEAGKGNALYGLAMVAAAEHDLEALVDLLSTRSPKLRKEVFSGLMRARRLGVDLRFAEAVLKACEAEEPAESAPVMRAALRHDLGSKRR